MLAGGPEAVGAFVSNGTLFVLGNTNPFESASDCIVIDTVGSQFRVSYGPHFAGTFISGSTVHQFFDTAGVTRIEVNTYEGDDYIYIENTSGRNLVINSGPDSDRIQFSNASGNLSLQNAGVISLAGGSGGNDFDTVVVNDHNTLSAQTYSITLARFDRPGWAGFSYAGDIESLTLVTGKGADTVNVPSTFTGQPIDIASAGGADVVNLGNVANGMRSINANIRISNSPSFTTINANSGADTLGRGWSVDDAGFGNFDRLNGLAPASILWNVSDISSVNITTGQGVDTGTIASTRATLRANSAGERDTVFVGSPIRGGLSQILAPVTIENSPSFSAVVIDDTGNSNQRVATLTNVSGLNTLKHFGASAPADIRFRTSDTSHVTIRTGAGSDDLSIDSIGLADAGQLFIDSVDGSDVVQIGKAPLGTQDIAVQKVTVNGSGASNLFIRDTGSTDSDAPVLKFHAGTGEQRLTGINFWGTTFAWNPTQMASASFHTGQGSRTIDVRSTRGAIYILGTTGSTNLITIGSGASAPDLGTLLDISSFNNNSTIEIDDTATTTGRSIVIDEFDHVTPSATELTGLGAGLVRFTQNVRLRTFLTGSGNNDIRVGALRSDTTFVGSTGFDTIHFGRDDVPGSRTSQWVTHSVFTIGFEHVQLNEQDRPLAGGVFSILGSRLQRPSFPDIETFGVVELHVALPDAGATIDVLTLNPNLTAVVHSGAATDFINVPQTGSTSGVRVVAAGDGSTGYDFIDAGISSFGADARVAIADGGYRGSISARNTGMVQASGAGTIWTQSLSFAGNGHFDIGAAAVVYDYAGASLEAQVRSDILAGFNAGAWNGPGIRSQLAAMSANLTVGYAEAAAVLSPGTTLWHGVDVDDTAVLLRATLGGDANLDGNVNLDDFTSLAASFGVPGRVFSQGDFTFDGEVSLNDFTILASNFGGTFASQPIARSSLAQPRPASNPAGGSRMTMGSDVLLGDAGRA